MAAAGNDSWSAPFWPAALDWAVGVGSLDRDGRVSDYSNFGVSADVYALGRNHVNAFPDGTFECHETPDKGDIRVFGTGMARWSGTSFAAPVVAGLIAREIPETGGTARDAAEAVLAGADHESDPGVGPIQVLQQPSAAASYSSTHRLVAASLPWVTVNRTKSVRSAWILKKPTSSSADDQCWPSRVSSPTSTEPRSQL